MVAAQGGQPDDELGLGGVALVDPDALPGGQRRGRLEFRDAAGDGRYSGGRRNELEYLRQRSEVAVRTS